MGVEDLVTYGALALLAALFVWQYGTKSGRDYRDKQKSQSAATSRAKADGTYVAPNQQKVIYSILGIGVYVFIGWIFASLLGGGLLFFIVLPGSALVGILFVLLSVKIADTAEKKKRSWEAFFWLSVLVSPIIMGIITAYMSATPNETGKSNTSTGATESEKLQELVKMKEAGFISEEDFQRKKSQILDRL